jgi:hypothetical protein
MSARQRYRLDLVVAVVALLLAGLTVVWRDWIEVVFRFDPDNRSGLLEWLIVGTLLTAAVVMALRARTEWRKSRAPAAGQAKG